MHRPTVGILALLMLCGGAALTWFGSEETAHGMWAPGMLRGGMLMGVIWLALPDVNRLPSWAVVTGTVTALLAVYFARWWYVWPALAGMAATIMVLRPRGSRRTASTRRRSSRGNPSA